jgi:hypothetical protein
MTTALALGLLLACGLIVGVFLLAVCIAARHLSQVAEAEMAEEGVTGWVLLDETPHPEGDHATTHRRDPRHPLPNPAAPHAPGMPGRHRLAGRRAGGGGG